MKYFNFLFAFLLVAAFTSCDTTKKVTSTPTTTPAPVKPDVPTGDLGVPGTITWEAANERYSAEGTFTSWRMTDVRMMGDDVSTMTARVEVDLTSISEKSPKLTDHLKAPDYFDVANHQLCTIDISNVTKGDGVYLADMKIKMRGETQKTKGQFKVTGTKPLRVKGFTMVDRSIFKVGMENTSVPNEIKVTFDTAIPR